MSDTGCVFVSIVVFVIVPIIGLFWWIERRRNRTRAEEVRLYAEQYERGERITQLLEAAGAGDASPIAQRELFELMQHGPVGHADALIAAGGWFDRVVPVLRRLLRSGSGAKVVSAYFECFLFPPGQQAKALEALNSILLEASEDRERHDVFRKLADRILSQSTPAEAHWLYARTLDMVETRRGTPASKVLALHIGRIAYAAARSDRTPTLYDEQAIANDIAARVASTRD